MCSAVAMGVKTVSLEVLKIQPKRTSGRSGMPPVFPEAERRKMTDQPASREVQFNVFRGDPPQKKLQTEATLTICKAQREEPLNSS